MHTRTRAHTHSRARPPPQIPVSKPKAHPKAKLLPKAMTKEERRQMLSKLAAAERQAKWEAEHPEREWWGERAWAVAPRA